MYYINKYFFILLVTLFSFNIYSQNIEKIKRSDTIYLNLKDSTQVMERTKIVVKNVFDKSKTEFNHFHVYFVDKTKMNTYKSFQLTNNKSLNSIKKISNHSIKLIDHEVILDYNFLNALGYYKTMDLIKNKKIYVIYKEDGFLKSTKVYEVKILNYSSLTN